MYSSRIAMDVRTFRVRERRLGANWDRSAVLASPSPCLLPITSMQMYQSWIQWLTFFPITSVLSTVDRSVYITHVTDGKCLSSFFITLPWNALDVCMLCTYRMLFTWVPPAGEIRFRALCCTARYVIIAVSDFILVHGHPYSIQKHTTYNTHRCRPGGGNGTACTNVERSAGRFLLLPWTNAAVSDPACLVYPTFCLDFASKHPQPGLVFWNCGYMARRHLLCGGLQCTSSKWGT